MCVVAELDSRTVIDRESKKAGRPRTQDSLFYILRLCARFRRLSPLFCTYTAWYPYTIRGRPFCNSAHHHLAPTLSVASRRRLRELWSFIPNGANVNSQTGGVPHTLFPRPDLLTFRNRMEPSNKEVDDTGLSCLPKECRYSHASHLTLPNLPSHC